MIVRNKKTNSIHLAYNVCSFDYDEEPQWLKDSIREKTVTVTRVGHTDVNITVVHVTHLENGRYITEIADTHHTLVYKARVFDHNDITVVDLNLEDSEYELIED